MQNQRRFNVQHREGPKGERLFSKFSSPRAPAPVAPS
jgi:hypothetical protein